MYNKYLNTLEVCSDNDFSADKDEYFADNDEIAVLKVKVLNLTIKLRISHLNEFKLVQMVL